MIPDALKAHIGEKLGQPVRSGRRASGGSINQAAVIELGQTGLCFLKWNISADPDMFVKEVKGLQLLNDAGTDLVIPEVIDQDTIDGNLGYLLMEYVEEGQPCTASAQDFGRKLAALHKARQDRFGLDHDNYIGKLPQSNARHESWIGFFIEERIEPQLEMAIHSGKLSPGITSSFKRMYKKLPGIFPHEPPSLLHGDLWGGNYFFDKKGKATIYDPAVYYGHREIELAFTHLFGGFSPGFYQAYNEAWPLAPGFNNRKDIYNLYPLLVHTNLFGGSYARQVESIVRQFS